MTRLIIEHNHDLHPPGEVRFLRSHKYITEQEKDLIRTCKRVNIPTRNILAIMAFFRGRGLSSLPYTAKQISNMGTKMRIDNGLNDMMQVVSFFEQKKSEDPLFYYSFKTDPAKNVMHIFWADGTGIRNYQQYGDFLSFDTTYKTNKYNLPFSPLICWNNWSWSELLVCMCNSLK